MNVGKKYNFQRSPGSDPTCDIKHEEMMVPKTARSFLTAIRSTAACTTCAACGTAASAVSCAASATLPGPTARSLGKLQAGTTCSGVFVVKDIESRQANVRDFFLIESNCHVLRQCIAGRNNDCPARAAGQRHHPSDSQCRYGFRPSLSLQSSLARRHDVGLPFTSGLVLQFI